ncbi:TPA: phosphonate metabolism protein PhnP [Escherichia coli]|nr:phosphonate metabolism protein PhnP [Escherichia coli]
MPACELRPATQYDTDAVYALICELKQAEFDHQAFRVGFNANLRDPNMRYQLALLDGEVVGMIGLHLQFHLHHVNWIGEIQELVVMPQARGLNVGSKLLAWGCECVACVRARRSPQYRRQPCSGVVKFNDAITLIDAGRHDLADRWSPGSFQQFLLTHYHMDHVQGLFPLRWGVGDQIPVYGPPDEQGCDDLFKHSGLLDFSHTVEPFVMFDLQGLQVTPLPLNHSKLTFGYLLETAHSRVAWLSDTAGLPEKTLKFLRNNQPQVMVIDCSHPPREDAPRNHCDLNTVLALNQVIRSPRVILTHISHQFDAWLMENALPSGFEAGFDGMEIEVA